MSVYRLLLLSAGLTLIPVLLGRAAEETQPRTDAYGDPLPAGVLARLGTARFKVPSHPDVLIFSPDGSLLALTDQYQICLVKTRTGKMVRVYKEEQEIPRYCDRLAFSPDGRLLAASGREAVVLLDPVKGGRVAAFATPGSESVAVSFSRDGKRLALGTEGNGRNQKPTVWDVGTKQKIATLPASHEKRVDVCLSPDGKSLASWEALDLGNPFDKNGVVQLWDVETGKELHRIRTEKGRGGEGAFSPDGKQFTLAEAYWNPTSWDVGTGKKQHDLRLAFGCRLLRYSPDGKRILAGEGDGAIELFDATSGKRLGRWQGPGWPVDTVAFLPGNKILAAGIQHQTLQFWEAPSGRVRPMPVGHLGSISQVGFSQDGKQVVSAGLDAVRFWDRAAGKEIRWLSLSQAVPGSRVREGTSWILLSPGGQRLLASNGAASEASVVDLATGGRLLGFVPRASGIVPVAAFSGDGATMAGVCEGDKEEGYRPVVQLWDVPKKKPLRRILVMGRLDNPVGLGGNTMALSRDGQVLALFDRSCYLWVWETRTGKVLGKTTLSGGECTAVAISPDGGQLAVQERGADSRVRLWDVARKAELRSFPIEEGPLYRLAFSPDGRTLAAVVGDSKVLSKVVLWELVTGKVRAEYRGDQDWITSLAFAPDGRTLATGGNDSTVLLWDLTGRTGTASKLSLKLTAQEQTRLWDDLANPDARKGHEAMIRLAAAPADAVALLSRELKPDAGRPLGDKEIDQVIAELDSDEFEIREKASLRLELAGQRVRPAMVKMLAKTPSPEVKRRLQGLLEILAGTNPLPGRIRPTRAVELLERLGTPEARRHLEAISRGNADSTLTGEARSALRRWSPRP